MKRFRFTPAGNRVRGLRRPVRCVLVFLPGFLSADNMLTLLQNVAVLGILGLAMAIVVLGRGIDISLIAALAVPPGLVLQMVQNGHSLPARCWSRSCSAIAFGLVNGWLIAYADVPSLFATLATGFPRRARTGGSVSARRRAVEPGHGWLRAARAGLDPRRSDADRDVRDRLRRRGAVAAPDALGRLYLRDRRQSQRRARDRHSVAADHRPAIRAGRADRLLRRPRHGGVGQLDADPHLQLDADL